MLSKRLLRVSTIDRTPLSERDMDSPSQHLLHGESISVTQGRVSGQNTKMTVSMKVRRLKSKRYRNLTAYWVKRKPFLPSYINFR